MLKNKNIIIYILLLLSQIISLSSNKDYKRKNPFVPPFQNCKSITKKKKKITLQGIVACDNQFSALIKDDAQTRVIYTGDAIRSYIVQKISSNEIICQKDTKNLTLYLSSTIMGKRKSEKKV